MSAQYVPLTRTEQKFANLPRWGEGDEPADCREWLEKFSRYYETRHPLLGIGQGGQRQLVGVLSFYRARHHADQRRIKKLESRVAEYENLSSHRGIAHGGRVVESDDAAAE